MINFIDTLTRVNSPGICHINEGWDLCTHNCSVLNVFVVCRYVASFIIKIIFFDVN